MDILSIIVSSGIALFSVWVGHLLTLRRLQAQHFLEKKVEYVSEFLGQAYSNLGYLAMPGDKENVSKGIATMKSFRDLGQKTAIFVSDKLASEIDVFTTKYAKSLLNINNPDAPSEDHYSILKKELNKLSKLLRNEIGKK